MAIAEPKTSPEKTSQYVNFDEFIEFQLKKTRNGIHHTDILSSAVVLCAVVLAYLFTFVIFDHWIVSGGISYSVRVALLGLLLLGIATWSVWKIVIPYMQQINILFAAREIERSHPELKSSLISLVDLRNSGKKISPQILKALEKRTALEISHTNVDDAVDRRTLMRASYTLLAIVALLSAYTVLSPKNITTSLWRALFPTSPVAVSTRTSIVQVTPGNSEVLARDQVDVTAELSGVIPEEATLYFSTQDRRFVNEPISMRNTGEGLPRFRGRLTGENGEGLLKDVTYNIVAGDTQSPTYTINVNQPPRAEVTQITYEYPTYMGLDRKEQDGANIDAWEGTWVTVHAQPNMELTRAMVLCSDEAQGEVRAEEYPLSKKSDGTWEAKWQLKIRSDGTSPNFYHVQVWNEKDETDPLPTYHRIKIRPDLKPEITLLHPTKDMDAPLNAVIPVAFTCSDPDFMLRRIDLKLEKSGEVLPVSPQLYTGPPYTSDFKTTYQLDLQKFKFQTGEQFSLYIQAQDNREPIDGISNDTTNSPKITITIIDPAPPEDVKQFEQQQQDQLNKQIEQASEEAQQDRNVTEQNPQEQNPADENMQPREDENPNQEPGENTEPGEPSDMPQDGKDGNPQPGQGNAGEPKNGSPQEATTPEKQHQPQDGSQPGTEDSPSNKPATEKPASEMHETQNRTEQNGTPDPQKNGTKQNSSTEQKPGENSNSNKQDKPRDKAADDEALKKLIDWNKQQQNKSDQTEKENTTQQEDTAKTESSNQTENSTQKDPQQNKEMSPEEKSKTSGQESQPKNGENTSDQKNDSTPPDSPAENTQSGKMNEDQKPGEMSPENSSQKPGDSPPGESPPEEMKPGKTPSKNNQNPDQSPAGPSESAQNKPDASENKGPDDLKPSDQPKNGEAMNREPTDAENAKQSDQDPKQMQPGEQTPKQSQENEQPSEQKSSEGKPGDQKPSDEKPTDEKPTDGKPTDGKPTDGKPTDGKPTDGKPTDGKPTDGKPSDGKPTDIKPNDGKPSDGKPSDEKPSDGKPSDQKPADGKPEGGKPSEGKPGDSKPGSGKASSQPPMNGGDGQAGDSDGSGSGEGAGTPTPDDPDLDNKKKATNLALKRLQDQLERGETPQELMDELGFNQQELETFMDRLEERLSDPGLDQTPETEAARRQFESLLKGIDYQSTGEVRGGGAKERSASQSLGSSNRPVPPEYRLDNEAYKRKLSQEGSK